MRAVVFLSGGVASWLAARRVRALYDDMTLLFTDTMIEDEDLYRALHDMAADLEAELVVEADGRDPWQVFFDVRFLGNTRVARCSHDLKQVVARRWVHANCHPYDTDLVIGLDWTELHRVPAVERNWLPYRVDLPLTRPPLLTKPQMLAALNAAGIRTPRLYEMGFAHNNCGGFCVKAGQGHFELLLRTMPDRYAYHEQREQELRDHLGADVAILRDRRGGTTRPMTLRTFRERLERDGTEQCDLLEIGGCGCFADG